MDTDVSEMNRVCVVCGEEFDPSVVSHCTDRSLIAVVGRRGRYKYYSLDGNELSLSDIEVIGEIETARFDAWIAEKENVIIQSQDNPAQDTFLDSKDTHDWNYPTKISNKALLGNVMTYTKLPGGFYSIYYPVNIEDIMEKDIILEVYGWFGKTQLFVNGHEALEGVKEGQFYLHRLDGSEVLINTIAGWNTRVKIIVDNKIIKVGNALRWYEWFWCIGLPLILVILPAIYWQLPLAVGIIPLAVTFYPAFNFSLRVFRSNIIYRIKIFRTILFYIFALFVNILIVAILITWIG